MLNVSDCILLIVNIPSSSPPEDTPEHKALLSIGQILKYAHALLIPTLYSLSDLEPQKHQIEALPYLINMPYITTHHTSLLADPNQELWRWPNAHRTQWIIGGMPSHIHVLQTALALHDMGKWVTICEDACASTSLPSHDRAMKTMRQAGMTIADTETIRYQWF